MIGADGRVQEEEVAGIVRTDLQAPQLDDGALHRLRIFVQDLPREAGLPRRPDLQGEASGARGLDAVQQAGGWGTYLPTNDLTPPPAPGEPMRRGHDIDRA